MIKESTFCIGYFVKIHGVRGNLILNTEFDIDNITEKTELLFVEIDGSLVPFFILPNGVRYKSGNKYIVSLDSITTTAAAEELKGKRVFIQEKFKEQPDEEGYTPSDLIGFALVDKETGPAGKVTGFLDFSGNPLLQILKGDKEILLPYNPDIITSVDFDLQTLFIDAPEGLLSL